MMNQADKENYHCDCIDEPTCLECDSCLVHSDCTDWWCIYSLNPGEVIY